MKNLNKLFPASIILVLFLSQPVFAVSYTWTGSSSTAWYNAGNWSPSGIPGSKDNVTIVSATNQPILDSIRTITSLTITSGTLDLGTKSLICLGNVNANAGTIQNGLLKPRGNLASFAGTRVDCRVEANCGYIKLSGGTFEKVCYLVDSSAAGSVGLGGCTFNDSLTIKHTGTGQYFDLAASSGDLFNGPVTLINTSNYAIRISTSGNTYFNNNLIICSENVGGILFSKNGGRSYLDTNYTISIGSSGFRLGNLSLINFSQLGNTSQSLNFSDSATVDMTTCSFNGDLTISAQGFLLKSNNFNGNTSFTKNGWKNYQSYGGNTFNGSSNILTNAGNAGGIRLATISADIFNNNVSFVSTGQSIQVGYTGNNVFQGDISINHANIVFNASTGRVKFMGSREQALNGSVNYAFYKVTLDKSSGQVTANTTLTVDDSLQFTSGNLITTDANLLTMKSSSKAIGANNNSFIEGPVQKIGNVAFEFPLGASGQYNPFSISGTNSVTNAYIVTYNNSPQQHGSTRDSSLVAMTYCNYWKLERVAGTDKVRVAVDFNENYCGLMDSASATIAWWDAQWTNLDVSQYTGNAKSGMLWSDDSLDALDADIVIAYRTITPTYVTIDLDADLGAVNRVIDHYFGLNGANTLFSSSSWDNLDMRTSVARMQPATMRFPGGTVGNYWDWRSGWFVDKNYPFQLCPGLPSEYESLTPENNSLETFRDALGTIGARPLFMLNMLTSNLPYQAAMLHEAEILGMPVKQVELGNEFYRSADHECEYNEIFPLANDYRTAALDWIDALDARFADADYAVVGADSRDSDRQLNWNSDMNLSAITTGIVDAATIHPYSGSAISASSGACELINYNGTVSNTLFNQAFRTFDNSVGIESLEWPELNVQNLWMTEYNLFDTQKHYIHGSWAHGLFTAASTFAMLEKAFITKVNCHTMVGNAVFSSFFDNSQNGLDFNPDPTEFSGTFCSIGEELPLPTGSYSVTSLGYAIKEIGEAARFAVTIKDLEFSGATVPDLGGTPPIPAIKGWLFEDGQGNEQIVILNLSNQYITVDFGTPTSFHQPDQMKVLSTFNSGFSLSERLNNFIINDASGTITHIVIDGSSVVSSDFTDPIFATYSATTPIPGYSIVRYSYRGANPVVVSASETAVCDGRPFYLYANAGPEAIAFDWYYNGSLFETTSTPFLLTNENGSDDYTVEVTYLDNTTAMSSNAVSVSEKTIQAITITTSSNSFCQSSNTPVTLTAELGAGDPSFRYCWISDNTEPISSGLVSQLSDGIQVMPQQTTTYTVYATDGQCSAKEEVTINVIGEIDFDPNPVMYCNSGSVVLNPHVTSGSLLWSNSATTSTITVSPSTPQTYTITVTDGSCVVTETIDVIPVECCSPSVDIAITTNSDADDLITAATGFTSIDPQTGNTIITNASIYIEKELLLDQDLIFNNVNIQFAERGSIIVDSYRIVKLNTCSLSACSGFMWQGIQVREKGHLFVDQIPASGTFSQISDAYHGINFEPWTSGIIRKTKFQNNYVGIQSTNIVSPLTTQSLKLISSSTFETTTTLFPVYANIPTLSPNGSNGLAGIICTDEIMAIGNSLGNKNYFGNLSSGIISNNSILNIINSQFEDMVPDYSNYGSFPLGIGISNTGSFSNIGYASLNITGLGTQTLDPPTFKNCISAVSTTQSSLTIIDSKSSNVQNGIQCDFPVFQPIVVLNNHIEAEQIGIGLFSADLSGNIDIRENEIEVDGSGNSSYGIGLFNSILPHQWRICRINCNDITLGDAQNGIIVSGFSTALASHTLGVNDNQIQINDNSVTTNGILFENVTGAFLQHNDVSGVDPTDATSTIAFRFLNSTSNIIDQNSSNGTKVGFQFELDCNSMDNIRGNIIYDHFHGMELQAGSFTGTQGYTGNIWSGYVGNPPYPYEEDVNDLGNYIGAYADPSMNQFDLSQSQFTVSNSSTLIHYPYYTPTTTDWFHPDIGSNPTFTYSNNCLVLPVLDEELRLGYVDSLIVNDTITSPVYQDELRINSALHLRDKLVLMKQNVDLPGFFATFLNGYSTSAPGQIARYRDTLSILVSTGNDSIDFVVSNDSILHSRLSEISLQTESGNAIEDSIILIANSTAFLLHQVRQSAVDQLMGGIQNVIYDLMDGVTTSNDIELNIKDAYLSYYLLLLGEDTSEIKSILYPIANQCIITGGPGVTIARNLLATIDSSIFYNDTELCGASRTGHSIKSNLNKQNIEFRVFPNPSLGMFSILIPKELINQKIRLSVFELSGELIFFKEKDIEESIMLLDCSDFVQGMYLLKIQMNQVYYFQKLSILK